MAATSVDATNHNHRYTVWPYTFLALKHTLICIFHII